ARYAIRSIPTLMVFKQGKLVNQINGSLPKNMFKQWLEQFMDV
ncbi:MAG: thioredoxin domain-containing protein, partial [Aeromonas veronii]